MKFLEESAAVGGSRVRCARIDGCWRQSKPLHAWIIIRLRVPLFQAVQKKLMNQGISMEDLGGGIKQLKSSVIFN